MRPSPLRKIRISVTESVILTIVILLIAVFSAFLVHNIESANREGIFAGRTDVSARLFHNRQTHTTSLADVEYIDTWMTFQYVNFIFSLPEDYLRRELDITDRQYPDLPIGRYLKRHGLERDHFVRMVQAAVRAYMQSHPKP